MSNLIILRYLLFYDEVCITDFNKLKDKNIDNNGLINLKLIKEENGTKYPSCTKWRMEKFY